MKVYILDTGKKKKIHREATRLIICSNIIHHNLEITMATFIISHHPCAPVEKEDNFNILK